MKYEDLTREQKLFIDYALAGHNILVDACIGSGKTTAIQTLCSCMQGKRVLYLTYNKLLKLDAQGRIRNGYVNVTNYHGFAFQELRRMDVRCGLSELIQVYNREKPECVKYNVLVLDEYQDIEQEIAEMLVHIKDCCPGLQIIAVGDMEQKIYDKTRLDVQPFIAEFLGNYIPMEFTTCFRLGRGHAEMLGRVWEKQIVGVNDGFEIKTMYEYQIRELCKGLKPSQLLVLGSKAGKAQDLQNWLESKCRDTFNKHTLWSKIKDTDGATSPTPDCAIFTTYDGCKGMEREVCVLFDWSLKYWQTRLNKPNAKYEILRNVFCVAASRAKRLLVIAKTDVPVEEDDLKTPVETETYFADMAITEMFDYKFIEDVEAAYACLGVKELEPAKEPLNVPLGDGMIDLSPCIGHFQEAMFFKHYDIDNDLEFALAQPNRSHMRRDYTKYTLDQKLLYLATLETRQRRYMNQVKALPVTEDNRERIRGRLAAHFKEDARVQVPCSLQFLSHNGRLLFTANGIMDVVDEGGMVYELKFVSELSHVHALQLAMYLACTEKETGRLYNTKNGQMLEISVRDRKKFLDCVARACTKGMLDGWYGER